MLYTKDTWESPSASTVQDNVYIGLESMKLSGKWLKHAQHPTAATMKYYLCVKL